MGEHAAEVRRAEHYAYLSLHWAFPLLPLLGLIYVPNHTDMAGALLWTALLGLVAWCGLVVLHTGLRRRGDLGPSGWDRFRSSRPLPWTVAWAVTAVLAAVLAPLGLPEGVTTGAGIIYPALIAVLAGIMALPGFGVGPVRITWLPYLLALVLAALATWTTADRHGVFPATVAAVVWAWMLLVMTVMFLNLLSSTQELDRARHNAARLAVTEERLRFSRDLHDVFGRTLSAVALKAELAAAQAEAGRPEAAAGMREVQTIATDALAEVRSLVRGYRDVDLTAELHGARALLESAGITVTTVTDGDDLPGPVARTFAWVVREAATNVLRHSSATQARIALSVGAAAAALEVSNDRPGPGSENPGSGLTGLAERLAEVGGTLEHDRRDGLFVLRAEVPAESLHHLLTAERSAS